MFTIRLNCMSLLKLIGDYSTRRSTTEYIVFAAGGSILGFSVESGITRDQNNIFVKFHWIREHVDPDGLAAARLYHV